MSKQERFISNLAWFIIFGVIAYFLITGWFIPAATTIIKAVPGLGW